LSSDAKVIKGSFVLGERAREVRGPRGEVVSSMESVPRTIMRKGSLDWWMEVRICWALEGGVGGSLVGVVGVVFSEEEEDLRMGVLGVGDGE